MEETGGVTSKLSVLLAISDTDEAKKIEEVLSKENDIIIEDTISDGFLLADKVKILLPDVIVIDYHLKNINVLDFVSEVIVRYPTTATLIIVDEEDLIDLRKFLSFRNVITRPLKFNELPQFIRNAFVTTIKKRKLLSSSFKEKKPGVLIVISSAKGGVGKSVISANLSLIFGNLKEQYKVILLDMNIPYGDQKAILGISPEKNQSVVDLLRISEELTPARISSIAVRSEAYPNFDIILSPNRANSYKEIDADCLIQAIKALKLIYDFIIVDANPGIDQINRTLFEESERILILFTPEISSIYRLVNFLRDFQGLRIARPPDLIYNRRSKKADKVVGNILAKVLPYQIYASITEDIKSFTDSLNYLYPAVTKKGAARNDMMRLAQALLEWYNQL